MRVHEFLKDNHMSAGSLFRHVDLRHAATDPAQLVVAVNTTTVTILHQ